MGAKGEKKKFKFSFELDVVNNKPNEVKSELSTDFQKESKDFISSSAELMKVVKPLSLDVEAELDDAEWDEKKIITEGYYSFRMYVKGFDQTVKEGKKKSRPDVVIKEFKSLEKRCNSALKKWLEKTASGKADNDKALKAGADAIKAVESADFVSFAGKARSAATKALEPFTKSGGKPDKKEFQNAQKGIGDAIGEFAKTWQIAFDAKEALQDAAKKIGSDKKADGSLKTFASNVKKQEGTLDKLVEGIRPILLAMFEAQEELAKDEPDAKKLKATYDKLDKMKAAEANGPKLDKIMKTFSKDFEKIEKSLK